jgi:hypothetical protein
MGRSGLSWLRIGSSGGLLWKRWWIFGFHKERIFFDNWVTISFSNNILHHGVKVDSEDHDLLDHSISFHFSTVTTLKYIDFNCKILILGSFR